MDEKEKKKALREIIKEAAEIEFAKENRPLPSEEENSQQDTPPEDMLEKIKKAVEDAHK